MIKRHRTSPPYSPINQQKKTHIEKPIVPFKNSTHVTNLVDSLKNTPKERVHDYLPTNSATVKLVETHVFIE